MSGSLDFIFYPTSVAVAGASPGKSGQLLLDGVLASGYKGKVYALNPRGEEVSGLKAYASLKDIPGPVDYLVCCIPAPAVPQLIRDCAAKGVTVVSVFTAGFSESGTEEGRRLEAELSRLARATGVRIIGPNCLGVYSPKVKLSFTSDFPTDNGKVALICQSGGNSTYLTRASVYRGVRFSKTISYGNACDINECELIEYLTQDAETEIVAVYIEGVKDGRRLHQALMALSKAKPVIVLKGGYTQAGAKAAASHTGSLAGSDQVWDELLQQAGVIRVYSLEEMVDMLVTFSFVPAPQGRRLGLFGGGGGASVLATDDWARRGFVLPPLPQEVRDEIRGLVTTEAGLILHNPVDLSSFAYSAGFYGLVKKLLGCEGFVDLLVIHIGFGQAAWFSASAFDAEINFFRDAIIKIGREIDKPLAIVMQYLITGWDWKKSVDDLQQGCVEAGLPVYYSMASAANTLDLYMRYYEKRRMAMRCGWGEGLSPGNYLNV